MTVHLIEALSASCPWPDGPSFMELFGWHKFNACTLLQQNALFNNFDRNMKLWRTGGITLHEDYAGTGNCGTGLKFQYIALTEQWLSNASPEFILNACSLLMSNNIYHCKPPLPPQCNSFRIAPGLSKVFQSAELLLRGMFP